MTDMRSRASRVAAEEERKRIAAFRAAPGGAKDMKSLGNFITQRDGERYDGMAEGKKKNYRVGYIKKEKRTFEHHVRLLCSNANHK